MSWGCKGQLTGGCSAEKTAMAVSGCKVKRSLGTGGRASTYSSERLLLPAFCLMRACGIRREPKHNFRNAVLPPAHPAPPPPWLIPMWATSCAVVTASFARLLYMLPEIMIGP